MGIASAPSDDNRVIRTVARTRRRLPRRPGISLSSCAAAGNHGVGEDVGQDGRMPDLGPPSGESFFETLNGRNVVSDEIHAALTGKAATVAGGASSCCSRLRWRW